MSSVPVVETRDLTRHYGATVGVEGLSLRVEAGEIFGFLGPNGSGKSTTIRLLLDLIRPTRGQALLFGSAPSSPAVRARVGYLPGELTLDGRMTGRQTLLFLASLDGRSRMDREAGDGREELCRRLGLEEEDLDRKIREYSRGMKQKLGLVGAFQSSPDLLILDEPTTGLDPLVREGVLELMIEARERGATVFHSSHVLSEVDRTCDRVGILRNGHLADLLTVEESRKASTRRMVVHFRESPPLAELAEAGVEVVDRQEGRLTLEVSDNLQQLLKVLARHPVLHLGFPEPGLEEAFTDVYSGGGNGQRYEPDTGGRPGARKRSGAPGRSNTGPGRGEGGWER